MRSEGERTATEKKKKKLDEIDVSCNMKIKNLKSTYKSMNLIGSKSEEKPI